MIVAKTVIPNQYWILRQNDRKIGNIEHGPDGFQVKINNQVQKFKTIKTLKQRVPVDFEPVIKKRVSNIGNTVNGFPTTSKPHNSIFDVKHQVPLWTKESRSKSWYAAGWYRIKQGRNWDIVECPKLIMLERYQYRGPYHSKKEAEQS